MSHPDPAQYPFRYFHHALGSSHHVLRRHDNGVMRDQDAVAPGTSINSHATASGIFHIARRSEVFRDPEGVSHFQFGHDDVPQPHRAKGHRDTTGNAAPLNRHSDNTIARRVAESSHKHSSLVEFVAFAGTASVLQRGLS